MNLVDMLFYKAIFGDAQSGDVVDGLVSVYGTIYFFCDTINFEGVNVCKVADYIPLQRENVFTYFVNGSAEPRVHSLTDDEVAGNTIVSEDGNILALNAFPGNDLGIEPGFYVVPDNMVVHVWSLIAFGGVEAAT